MAFSLGVVGVVGQLHAAGLAPAAGLHLCLDDDTAGQLRRLPPRASSAVCATLPRGTGTPYSAKSSFA